MAALVELWLPILAAAVAVFFASFLAWMVLPHHRKDFKRHPDEDSLLEELRSKNVAAGQYMFPHCANCNDMKDPEFIKRYAAGPHGTLNVWSSAPSMGRNLPLTFLFYVLVGVFVAYLATMTRLDGNSDFMSVFRFAGAAAVATYAIGPIANHIWFGKSLRAFVTSLVDDIVYGIITGLVFAWLWPGGA